MYESVGTLGEGLFCSTPTEVVVDAQHNIVQGAVQLITAHIAHLAHCGSRC